MCNSLLGLLILYVSSPGVMLLIYLAGVRFVKPIRDSKLKRIIWSVVSITIPCMFLISFTKECLGEEAYHNYVGKIAIFPRNKEPLNSSLDSDLESSFYKLLTEDEIKEINTLVTEKPCVVLVPTKQGKYLNDTIYTYSPFISLREPEVIENR